MLWIALIAWVASAGAGLLIAAGIPNSGCLECHADKELTKTNVTGQVITLYVDEAALLASAHRTNSCASCHSDLTPAHPDDNAPAAPVRCAICHATQSESYGASVHGQAAQAGEPKRASCSDCHGTHTIVSNRMPNSPLHALQQTRTCGVCHTTVAQEVGQSVHGQALRDGKRDAPACTDCHSEHRIEPLRNLPPIKIAEEICSRCHDAERINTKYRMPRNRVRTFLESYHGLAAKFGSTQAANCASCHGVHLILRSTDTRSTIHPNHLAETCGRCHPGAGQNFVQGKVHLDDLQANDRGALINRWARRIYLALIVVLISAFAFHNLGLWWRRALLALRSARRAGEHLSKSQRWQHGILAVSFVALALTGFALKYPDSWIAIGLGSSEPLRRWAHRVAAIILMALGVFHVYHVAFLAEGRKLLLDFWPRWKDFEAIRATLLYIVGRKSEPREAERFGYPEKMEYWAVLWGSVVMAATGLMIWFPVLATTWLPRWAVDVALTIHYYEAVLACLAIVVWHFYHVIFAPEVYPINWAFWDGKHSEATQPGLKPGTESAPRE